MIMSHGCFAASFVTSTTSVSVQREMKVNVKPCNCSANVAPESSGGDEDSDAVCRSGALAKSTSVFMPQMLAQHVTFAVLAVRLKLSVFTSPALALRSDFETALGRGWWLHVMDMT